jgi:hypothetical protein
MKIKTVCFSETLVSIYMSTRRYYPERQHLYDYYCALKHFAVAVYKGRGDTCNLDLGLR